LATVAKVVKKKPAPVAPNLPSVAVKPKHATKPSIPLPPPPPPPPADRDEMLAGRDIARLLRYGERFGEKTIDIRMIPDPTLPIAGNAIGLYDPTNAKSYRVLDRPAGNGNFRVMLSVAKQPDKPERLAALIVHVGRPPIAKWTVAHFAKDKKPKSADALPRVPSRSGFFAVIDGAKSASAITLEPNTGVQPKRYALPDGRAALVVPCPEGEFAAYWAVDATDKPICLVIDFDVLTQKDWKSKPG
jgi:hypothetical protein